MFFDRKYLGLINCCHHDMKMSAKKAHLDKLSLFTKLKEASGHFHMNVTMVGKDILIDC